MRLYLVIQQCSRIIINGIAHFCTSSVEAKSNNLYVHIIFRNKTSTQPLSVVAPIWPKSPSSPTTWNTWNRRNSPHSRASSARSSRSATCIWPITRAALTSTDLRWDRSRWRAAKWPPTCPCPKASSTSSCWSRLRREWLISSWNATLNINTLAGWRRAD